MRPIKLCQMNDLKQNYRSKTQKAIMDGEKEMYRQLNATDTKTSWFSKKDIEQLFKENLNTDKEQGLLIHIITHDAKKYGPLKRDYDNQQTVVLTVSNENEEPMIDDTENLEFKFQAKGGVSDKLCPPEICTGT